MDCGEIATFSGTSSSNGPISSHERRFEASSSPAATSTERLPIELRQLKTETKQNCKLLATRETDYRTSQPTYAATLDSLTYNLRIQPSPNKPHSKQSSKHLSNQRQTTAHAGQTSGATHTIMATMMYKKTGLQIQILLSCSSIYDRLDNRSINNRKKFN